MIKFKKTIARDIDIHSRRTKRSYGIVPFEVGQSIFRRLKAGEMAKDIAKDLGLTKSRVEYFRIKIYYQGKLLSGK